MRKSKLDKLIEKNEEKIELNYSLLKNAKDELRERNARNKSVKPFNLRKFAQILVPISCAIIVVIVSIIFFLPTKDEAPAMPPSVEVPPIIEMPPEIENPDKPPIKDPETNGDKHFSATMENFYRIQSVEELNQNKNISLHYFDLLDCEERLRVYIDEENEKDMDVLLSQKIILLETYETIEMYVELQDNYIFDFLDRFNDLSKEIEIAGIVVKYETSFDEEQYLYCTMTTFEIDGFKYRVEFFLEDHEQWNVYLAKILR